MSDPALAAGAGGGDGNGNGNGGGGGSAPPPFSLDMAFDLNAVPEADRPLFESRKVAKLADVVSWAVDAEKRAQGAAKIAPDAKLDLSLFPNEYQKTLSAKKLETVQALADSVIHSEKFIGSLGGKTPLMAPEAGKLGEWMGKHAEQLGVPKDPKDYQWNKPQQLANGVGIDDHLEASFRDFAHKRHLPQEMFQDFADFGVKMAEGMMATAAQQVQREAEDMQAELTRAWGGSFKRNVEVAQFAARQLGLEGKIVDALARETGNAATLQLLHRIGEKMDGATLITGDGSTQASAKDQARAELDVKQRNADWSKDLIDASRPGHKAAVEEQARLMAIIHG